MTESNDRTRTEPRVLVLGSANVDTFLYVDDFPAPGETIFGRAGRTGLGGKGANQVVAAQRTGAETTFVGMVGDDDGGAFVRRTLDDNGVDTSALLTSASAPTGAAYISVNAEAENTIVVVSGANAELTADALVSHDIDALIAASRPTIALTQGELAPDTIAAFAAASARSGVRFVLNLAPAAPVDPAALRVADPLIVNEGEAQAIARGAASEPGGDIVAWALATAQELVGTVSTSVVITLGASGAVAATADEAWHQPSPRPAEVVDTTGAGDAFVGALAAVLAAGRPLAEAVRWGVAAGSAAVAGHGTVESYTRLARYDHEALPAESGRTSA